MAARDSKQVPIFCYQCVGGPDLMKVEVEDGVAIRIESNYGISEEHPGGGRVCVRAYGLIQKTYSPHRVQQPMKRTNPKKGRAHDPGFTPITWDEALDIVAGKMTEMQKKGLRDESGAPRLAVTTGGGGTPVQYGGTFPAFMAAWGPIDQGFGAGQGVKCYHSEHLYGELWHRAFVVSPDTPYCNYVINCGNNSDSSGGVAGIWRQADARVRGMKRVQVEPHLSITGAMSAEWIPIKPKTDAAFLYALVNHILFGHDWREVCDKPFLENDTNSPYLVGPNGYFLREAESGKPLIWDLDAECAKPFDAEIGHPAMEGSFTCAGIEQGADGETFRHDGAEAEPAFQKLLDHMRDFTPEWAEGECDVPAERIRQVAEEYLAHACVGETIEIEGRTLPLRPVAVMLGKGVNNGWGGYQTCWARTLLACLVGALEVPGGTLGTTIKLVRPAASRTGSVLPGPDGFMAYKFNETSKDGWQSTPDIRNAYKTLVPLVSDSPWSAALGPAHLPWLFQKTQPDNWVEQTKPDMWICYRSNPAISSWNAPEVAERIAEFPFTVAFAYTMDETNHMADILLPEATDLESLQLIRIGGTKFQENFWKHEGWAIRQPAVENAVDCMDLTDVSTELAKRVGILEDYNEAINRGAAGMKLRVENADYGLEVGVEHDREEIWDRVCLAASHDLSGGAEVRGLDWFKTTGYMLAEFPQLDWYLYPSLKDQGLRFELPYQERILRHGTELAHRLHEIGVNWWDKQLDEYEPLPGYERFPDIWINYAKEVGRDPDEFPLWALTTRSTQYSWGANVGIPVIKEVADNIAGHRGVIVNRKTARALGIEDGDPVVIESVSGVTKGYAVLREGIRPDTVVMVGQFDHWKTPVAKDFNLASLNSVTALSVSLTDGTGSSADIARVKLSKGEGKRQAVA
ncbi:MAG: molybdopterin-dependent oxidoreductase [Alphaproteobacteria bacterium]|jgi:phenylacetyl-CoA:acceptor oxidoreductase|nr:molybdopterin-dependent oxidoreductase [Alphaproteobacteria bacterium]